MNTSFAFIPAAHYHCLTPLYEVFVRPVMQRVWKRITEEVSARTPQGGSVIDLGCGPGSLLRMLRRRRPDLRLTGTDIDPAMIAIAQHKARDQNIAFAVASIDHQELPDQSCDIAISSMMFHHLPHEVKQGALREVRRILKTGGIFLLCDFSVPDRKRWWLSIKFWQYIEPEIIPQLEGELLTIAKEAGATIETLQTFYSCIALHLLKFPSS